VRHVADFSASTSDQLRELTVEEHSAFSISTALKAEMPFHDLCERVSVNLANRQSQVLAHRCKISRPGVRKQNEFLRSSPTSDLGTALQASTGTPAFNFWFRSGRFWTESMNYHT
jgi:hypothetical protein